MRSSAPVVGNCAFFPLLLTTRPPPRSTLFPYTTLFRSVLVRVDDPTVARPELHPHDGVDDHPVPDEAIVDPVVDRKSTRLNSSHLGISYAVFCLKKKKLKLYAVNRAADAVHRAGRAS